MSTEQAIVMIVIFGLVMVVSAILYKSLFDVGNQEFTQAQCRLSLQLTKVVSDLTPSVMGVRTIDNFVPLQCSRRFLKLSDTDVLKDGKSIRQEYNPICPDVDPSPALTGQLSKGQCLAKNVMAKEMTRCWQTFFEGEYPVFQQVEAGTFKIMEDRDNFRACFVCAEVMLDTDITDFRSYMKEKRMVADQSYYDFLANNREAICNPTIRGLGGNCWEGVALGRKNVPAFDDQGDTISWWREIFGNYEEWDGIELDSFPSNQVYAITFIRHGMKLIADDEDLEPDEYPTMTVHALPADRISEYCGVVMV